MNAAAAARTEPWRETFVERGHGVTVFTSREAKDDKNQNVWSSRFGVPSNQVGLVRRFLQEIRLGRDLAGELRRRASRFDLAVITSPPFFLGSMCARSARLSKLPYVFDVRDRYPGVLFELGTLSRDGLPGRFLSKIEQRVYAGARSVTTVTDSLVQELMESSNSAKVSLVPNGYDGKLFPEALLKRKKRDQFTVIYHGRFSRLHDIDSLRQMANIAQGLDSEIRFIIAGPLPQGLSRENWGKTTFLGELPRKEIPELLAGCHLGVSLMKPSGATRVAMPAKAFEYFGVGLPVIAAPEGELSVFLRKHRVGLPFSNADPSSMAQAIVSIKNDFPAWEMMSANARALRPSLDRRVQAVSFAKHIESLV
jgi:glycosyltransferase involved in cell wall biosynthesis